ncbi:YrhB family protein (plasmid) [Streptomyces caniferus]|uniref:YrhB domain-containing protein n=1 Tax=Streptomyces caniferus TaxID=285557 RepID=UPI002E2CC9F6|nr:YrhB domain-containing protein [Streptomyces caniferus]
MTLSRSEALKKAEELLVSETGPYDPALKIDHELVMERDGLLIVPYNSEEYLETRDQNVMLLDCWPILVDLATGKARLGKLEEMELWRE